MIEDSELSGVEYPPVETETGGEPGEPRRPGKARRLLGVALLVFLAVVAVIVFVPSLWNGLVPQRLKTRLARVASPGADPEPLPAVRVLWKELDLNAMPDNVVLDLRSGKYYYDRHLPGNFGLAINYWKKALARPEAAADREKLQNLVASAGAELSRQFSSDSADAFVLLKQGKRDEAVALLEKMRADYEDIRARQYVWASQMLYRRRR